MWFVIKTLSSPKKFFYLSQALNPWLVAAFLITFTYGLIGGLFLSPPDYLQGEGFRIIYVHVPCAFLSLLIYLIMAAAAVFVLVYRLTLASLVITHSLSLGLGFTFLALVTGSLWGKPMWGTWWIWDARLTSELILLFLYAGIFLFQSASINKKTADRAVAILVLVGFIDIPIIHYSVYWWNTLHQGSTLSVFSASKIDSAMLHPLIAMIVAFCLYYVIVLFLRLRFELTAILGNHHWINK